MIGLANMHRTVTTWPQFKQHWSGVLNFLIGPEVTRFEFDLPPVEQFVDELRRCPGSRIYSGVKGTTFDQTDISESFRKLPIEQAMEQPFNIANFQLDDFYAPGRVFHELQQKWVEPWGQALGRHGFSWKEFFPIVFTSGRDCATNYHMDRSHVLLWQRYGKKTFNGLKEPDRWTTIDQRYHSQLNQTRPAALIKDDILQYEMQPGAVLWNVITTPHWVDAADEVAVSLGIVHRGLRLDGQLCPHEDEVSRYGRQLEAEGKAPADEPGY